MTKRSFFKTPLGGQRVNRSQTLVKSARHHFYPVFLLTCDKLSWKKFLLVRPEILGLFVNTLTADGKYSHNNRENFPQQIQMQLSQKAKLFSGFLFAFPKFTSYSEYFEKKDESHSLSISEIIGWESGDYLNVQRVLFWNTP